MKTADLRAKTEDQLKEDLLNLAKERFNFRFQKSTAQLENTSRIRVVRRDIAKVQTVLAEIKQGKLPTAAAKASKKPAKAAGVTKKKKESKE
jgi:large subunit ribosomal protein L29